MLVILRVNCLSQACQMAPSIQEISPVSSAVLSKAGINRRTAPVQRLPWNFAEWFVLSQTFLPALLYLPGTQPFRVPIRVGSYGISLAALAYFWFSARNRRRLLVRPHPSSFWLLAAMAYLSLMVFHPNTNNLLSGAAQVFLYLAILAPVLWAQACVDNPQRLARLLWLLLICNGINAFVGVMQVRDPNTWLPQEFSSSYMQSEFGLGTAIYEGANGNIIIRPPGLGDAPGAVAGPAVFALYLGLVVLVSERAWWKKILAAVFAWLGAQAIFLSLVRSSFLIAVGMIILFCVIQATRRRPKQAGVLLLVAAGTIIFAFFQSSAAGGESLVDRFMSIMSEDPMSFYYENRGNQVQESFIEILPKYPFGAGLGRWGMTSSYFGNPANTASPPIWVEIQWPAWIVDGGFVLLLLYPIALVAAMWQQLRIAFCHPNEDQRQLGSIILAANAGLLALCFSYPVFLSPAGMQFWFLAGASYSVATRQGSVWSPRPLSKPRVLARARARTATVPAATILVAPQESP